MANTICYTLMNTSGEVETQLHKIIEKASWLKKVTPKMRSFFDLFDFDWFESRDHSSEVHSRHWCAIVSQKLLMNVQRP